MTMGRFSGWIRMDFSVNFLSFNTGSRHGFQTDDAALQPIAAKVEAGERLSFDDGVALYRGGDILAIGWMANQVRERMHGDIAYFNVNRHINPTRSEEHTSEL